VQHERSSGSLHDRLIQQRAVERDGAEALALRLFKRIDHASRVRNLRGARAEDVIDRFDLPGMDACRIEGFGGFEGKMKMAKVNGTGSVTLRDSGQRSDLDILGDITVKVV